MPSKKVIKRARKQPDIATILAEEAELAERDRDKNVRYVRVGRPPKPVAERGQVYSLRMPLERLEEVRKVAASRGMQPAALAREWILERLDRESPRVVAPGRSVKRAEPAPKYRRRRPAAKRVAASPARRSSRPRRPRTRS